MSPHRGHVPCAMSIRPGPRGSRGRPVEADEQRVADQRVADRDLVEVRQAAEQRQVVEVEVVAGVDAEAEIVGQLGGGGEAAPARPRRGRRRSPARTARCTARSAARRRPLAHRTASRSASMNSDTRTPSPCRRDVIAPSSVREVSVGHPAWLVISPGRTGTRVHWCGRSSSTSASRSGRGVALDVELDAARAAAPARSRSPARRRPGCARSSARGWIVIPGAPAATIVRTAAITLGTSPPRALRRVATLLTLTLRRAAMPRG